MSSLRRLAPRFIDWRLSRIDEEVDRLSCCSSDAACTPRTPSPPLPPPPPALLLHQDDPAPSESSPADPQPSAAETPTPSVQPDPSPAAIYSNADEWRKQQQLVERRAVDDEREALRFIREKYDSLGKISVEKPAATSSPVAVPDHQSVPAAKQQHQNAAALYENVTQSSASLDDTDATTAAAAVESHHHKVSPPPATPAAVECVECCNRTAKLAAAIATSNSVSGSQPVATTCSSVSKQLPVPLPASATVPKHGEMIKPSQCQRPAPPAPCQCHHHHHQQQQQRLQVSDTVRNKFIKIQPG